MGKLILHKKHFGEPLSRFEQVVEGFNQRSLRLFDLVTICEALDIEIVEKRMRSLHGSAYEEDGFRFVYINSLISPAEQVVAGFHELFHIFHHIGDGKLCQSRGATVRLSKQEKQAQAAGVIALMPLGVVYELSIEEMMREFDVSRRLAEFRLMIFRDLGW